MSTKEIMKYGFRYSNHHFKEKRILQNVFVSLKQNLFYFVLHCFF